MSRNNLGQFQKRCASEITSLRRSTARDRADTRALASVGRFGRKPDRKRDCLQWQQAKFLKAFIVGEKTLDTLLLEMRISLPRFANWLTDAIFKSAYDATLQFQQDRTRAIIYAARHAPLTPLADSSAAPPSPAPPDQPTPSPATSLPQRARPDTASSTQPPSLSSLHSARRSFLAQDLPDLRAAGVDPADPAAVRKWLDDKWRADATDEQRQIRSRYRDWCRANRPVFEAANDLDTWSRIVNEPDQSPAPSP